MKEGLRSLRYDAEFDAICEALERARAACRVGGRFRVIEFSVQTNHLHLIVEANGNDDLQTGMRGLMACLGNAMRKLWQLNGSLFADRYHLEILKNPTRMRNAYRYVLNNARKHNSWTANKPDPYSSGPWFRGWLAGLHSVDRPRLSSPCSPPRSWLAGSGWLRAGPRLAFSEDPGRPRKTLTAQRSGDGHRSRAARTRPSALSRGLHQPPSAPGGKKCHICTAGGALLPKVSPKLQK